MGKSYVELSKKAFFRMIALSRIPELLFSLRKEGPKIFLYHGVSPRLSNYGIFNYRKKFIYPDAFRAQILWLKKHTELLPLSSIIERLDQEKSFPPGMSAITFDDGYENFFEHAFPILKELEISATVFVTTDLVEKKEPLWVDKLEYAIGMTKQKTLPLPIKGENREFALHTLKDRIRADIFLRSYLKKLTNREKEALLSKIIEKTGCSLKDDFLNSAYKGLTWSEIREMQKYGITFAPHTKSHPILSKLSGEEAKNEIIGSWESMKNNLGECDNVFAYPNGEPEDFTDETVKILKNAGFRAALTTSPGTVHEGDDPFLLPRFSLDGTDESYMFRITATGLRWKLKSLLR